MCAIGCDEYKKKKCNAGHTHREYNLKLSIMCLNSLCDNTPSLFLSASLMHAQFKENYT